MAIDRTKLEGMPLDAVRTLTVGLEGTSCTVEILRGERCAIYIHICIGVSYSFREYIRHAF